MRALRCLSTVSLFGVLLLISAAEGQSGRRAAAPASHRWALLIGVEDYMRLDRLHYSGADMRALREQLIACGFPQRQIILLDDKAGENRFRPFKSAIDEQLELALKMVGRGDLLVIGFSGHGVYLNGKSYLCPVDARLADADSMICVETLYQRLAKCPAALKLVLVDACRDDPRPSGDKSIGPAPELGPLGRALERPPEGIYCLTSCAPGETSKEDARLGHGVFMLGEKEKAIADCGEAIRLDPEDAEAYRFHAEANLDQGKFDEALEDCRKGMLLDPKDGDLYLTRASAYNGNRELDKAVADCTEAIRLDPEDVGAYGARATLYNSQEKFNEAATDCGKAILLNAKLGDLYQVRAVACAGKGEFQKAIADCTEAIRLDPENVDAYRTRAITYNDQNRWDKAIADCQKAMLLDATVRDIYQVRAYAYRGKHELDTAIADCDEALRLDPNNAQARRMRDSLTESKKKPPARGP